MYRIIVTLVLLFNLVSCSGRSHKRLGEGLDSRTKEFLSHRVRFKGETLSLISLWYTGCGENWRILKKFNSMPTPSSLDIGDEVMIPRIMLLKEEPFPKQFISSKGRNTGVGSRSLNDSVVKGKDVSDSENPSPDKSKKDLKGSKIKNSPYLPATAKVDPSNTPSLSTSGAASGAGEQQPEKKVNETNAIEPGPSKSKDQLLKELLGE